MQKICILCLLLAMAAIDLMAQVRPLAKELRTLKQETTVYCAAFSPDGKIVAVGDWNNTITLWNTGSGEQIKTLKDDARYLYAVAFSPDATLLAGACQDGRVVKIWEVQSGDAIINLLHNSPTCLVFSKDGKILVSGGQDNFVRIWNLNDGSETKAIDMAERVKGVAITNDGKLLAVACGTAEAKLVDVESGNTVRVCVCQDLLTGNTPELETVAFSEDGKYLFGGGGYSFLNQWEVATGKLVRNFLGHRERVYSLAVAANAKLLISASGDDSARLWAVESGRQCTLKGHTGDVYAAILTADGSMAATVSADYTIKLWKVELK